MLDIPLSQLLQQVQQPSQQGQNQQVTQPVNLQQGRVGQSGGYQPIATGDAIPKDQLQALAQQKSDALFGPGHFAALQTLVNNESGWNPAAANQGSSARGLFQFLDSTSQKYGLGSDASQADPAKQLDAGLQYIKDRYQNPTNALDFWVNKSPTVIPGNTSHWY